MAPMSAPISGPGEQSPERVSERRRLGAVPVARRVILGWSSE